MTPRGRTGWLVAAVAAIGLALPAAGFGHASLLHTTPSASGLTASPPAKVTLTFSEPVEPRFAIVSVTDAGGRQLVAGHPFRSPTNPNELVVQLKFAGQGWYLVFWRAISQDGHPVRGAFTYAVGFNPGPAPQFVIPSISETATTPALLVARWITFLSLMAAVGLLVFRFAIARGLVRAVPGTTLRGVSLAYGASLLVALVATPVYVVIATAKFALRSVFDLSNVIPLARASAFGRGYLDLELLLLLLAFASAIALWVDRPARTPRSVAEILASSGAAIAAGCALLVPGIAGHAGETSPRGLAIAFDGLHLLAGSVWLGGLIGLLVLWGSVARAQRLRSFAYTVPRFSNVALVSVFVLIASGTGAAILHLPALSAFWQTSYGKALGIKILLLVAAMGLASVNLARNKPRLAAYTTHPDVAPGAGALLRRLVGAEGVIVVGIIFAAGVLSSLPPPPKASASAGQANLRVGPGPVKGVVQHGPYRLAFGVTPNRAAVPNVFVVRITRNGRPVPHAEVTTTFTMLDMQMGTVSYNFAEQAPGVYQRSAPALVMVGHWGLSVQITPPGEAPFNVLLVDRANG